MKAIVFGATGMVSDLRHDDSMDFSPGATQLTGYDACFFCLGVSSASRVIGRALIEVARHGAPKAVLENWDIAAGSGCD